MRNLTTNLAFLKQKKIDGIYRILYEEVDETDVGIVKFPSFNGDANGIEEYRFPAHYFCTRHLALLLSSFKPFLTDFLELEHRTRNLT